MDSVGFNDLLIRVYAMLMRSEGHFRDEDGRFGRKIAKVVGVDKETFINRADTLSVINREDLVDDTIIAVRRLPWNEQVLCVAWLCVMASADGKMDEVDWSTIYKIYHKELHLPLREILKTQNWLTRSVLV